MQSKTLVFEYMCYFTNNTFEFSTFFVAHFFRWRLRLVRALRITFKGPYPALMYVLHILDSCLLLMQNFIYVNLLLSPQHYIHFQHKLHILLEVRFLYGLQEESVVTHHSSKLLSPSSVLFQIVIYLSYWARLFKVLMLLFIINLESYACSTIYLPHSSLLLNKHPPTHIFTLCNKNYKLVKSGK